MGKFSANNMSSLRYTSLYVCIGLLALPQTTGYRKLYRLNDFTRSITFPVCTDDAFTVEYSEITCAKLCGRTSGCGAFFVQKVEQNSVQCRLKKRWYCCAFTESSSVYYLEVSAVSINYQKMSFFNLYEKNI